MAAPKGNQHASRAAHFRGKIRAILAKLDGEPGRYDGYTESQLFEAYVNRALTDDNACRDYMDRMYGKPAQAVVGGDEDDRPINFIHRIERVLIAANAKPADG